MEVYPKIPENRFSSVGAQPSGRSCAESPWGQGSYSPKGVAGIIFSWFVVSAPVMLVYLKMAQSAA
jgi:hypothetical protein